MMAADVAKRPPNDRGQGRKSLAGGGTTPMFTIRLTSEQKDKISRLGGPEWIRKAIDSADDGQAVQSMDKATEQAIKKAVAEAVAKMERTLEKIKGSLE
jgi:hypothetical protein